MDAFSDEPDDHIDFRLMAHRVGWLAHLVSWAINPERPRDAEYRLAQLAEEFAEYQRRVADAQAK